MAKMNDTKTTVSLDNDSKRILRNLTKAIDRLSRNIDPPEAGDGRKRLVEPAEDLEPGEAQLRTPQTFDEV